LLQCNPQSVAAVIILLATKQKAPDSRALKHGQPALLARVGSSLQQTTLMKQREIVIWIAIVG